jgi:hypothetical protein
MAYYRSRRPARARLTPPAELVGHNVRWQPKAPDGTRAAAVYGHVQSFEADARTLTIRVQQTVSMWQTHPHRDITVSLSSGPFTVI